MKRALLVSTVALLSPLATLAPAAADAPLPRGPVGGCPAAFELKTIEEVDAIDPAAGAVARTDDINRDEKVCVKFFRNTPGGRIVDNRAVGRS